MPKRRGRTATKADRPSWVRSVDSNMAFSNQLVRMWSRPFGQEGDQLAIHLLGVGPSETVWSAGDDDESTRVQALVEWRGSRGERQDAVGVAVHDERGDVHAAAVEAEIGRPRGYAVARTLEGG